MGKLTVGPAAGNAAASILPVGVPLTLALSAPIDSQSAAARSPADLVAEHLRQEFCLRLTVTVSAIIERRETKPKAM